MRSGAIGFAVVFVVGLAALALVGLTQKTSLVYSLGVNPATTAATLQPHDRACQAPVRPPTGATFDRIGFRVGAGGGPIGVEVRAAPNGRRLASGRLAPGYSAAREQVVDVGRVQESEPLRLCLVNDGRRPVTVVGQIGGASPHTSGTLNGKPIGTDITFNLRSQDRSLLASLPDLAKRAAVFRASVVSPVVYLLLALAIIVGAPLLIARALDRAAAADGK